MTFEASPWSVCLAVGELAALFGPPIHGCRWVQTLGRLHHVPSVHAQFDRVVDALTEKLPAVAQHLEASPGVRRRLCCRVSISRQSQSRRESHDWRDGLTFVAGRGIAIPAAQAVVPIV